MARGRNSTREMERTGEGESKYAAMRQKEKTVVKKAGEFISDIPRSPPVGFRSAGSTESNVTLLSFVIGGGAKSFSEHPEAQGSEQIDTGQVNGGCFNGFLDHLEQLILDQKHNVTS